MTPVLAPSVLDPSVLAPSGPARPASPTGTPPWFRRRDPGAVVVAVLGATVVTNAADVVESHLGISPYLPLLVVSAAVLASELRTGTSTFRWSPVFGLVGAFLASRLVSLVGTAHLAAGITEVTDLLKDTVLLVILVGLVGAGPRLMVLVESAVWGTGAVAAASIANQVLFGGGSDLFGFSHVPLITDLGAATPRHAGPFDDPNFWARNLSLLLPLALSAALLTRGRRRWVSAGSAGCMAGALFLTQSRGGMLAVFLGVGVWLVMTSRGTRRALLVTPLVVGLTAPIGPLWSRLSTLGRLGATANGAEDLSLVGRVAAQEVGWHMFTDHPVTGAGAGSFEQVSEKYFRSQGSGLRSMAPHNTYLQVAAEGGVVGLMGWLIFLLGTVGLAARALFVARERADGVLASGAMAGLLAWAAASVALHLSNVKILFIVVAVVAAVDWRVRDSYGSSLVWRDPWGALGPERGPEGRHAGRWSQTLVAVGVIGGLVAGGWLLTSSREDSRATVPRRVLQVQPRDQPEGFYPLDVAGRPGVVLSVAALARTRLAADGSAIVVTPNTRAGLITLTGTPGEATPDLSSAAARVVDAAAVTFPGLAVVQVDAT